MDGHIRKWADGHADKQLYEWKQTSMNVHVEGDSSQNKADRHKSRTRNSISHFAKKKVKWDRRTDRPTDRPTDGPTDTVAYRVACTR